MIKTLYFDKHIVVCEKPVGILSQADSSGAKNLPEILKKETNSFYIEAVHRLDRDVSGVMVYARNKKSAGILSEDVKARRFQKEYFAVVHGKPEEQKGTYKDFLFKDREHCKSYVVKSERKGAKEAVLDYQTVASKEYKGQTFSLVKIQLMTGRTHQIRVQFSSRQMPLAGDKKYGGAADKCDIALFSAHLGFSHPITHEFLSFDLPLPDKYPFNLFKNI